MDNTEKAVELVKQFLSCMNNGVSRDAAVMACLMEMAEWKDKQSVEGIIKWIKENNGVYWRPWLDDSGDFYRGDLMDDFYDDLRKAVKKGE